MNALTHWQKIEFSQVKEKFDILNQWLSICFAWLPWRASNPQDRTDLEGRGGLPE